MIGKIFAVGAGLLCATPIFAQSEEVAAPRCDYGAPHPDAPDEIRQFDFLIGDFSVDAHIWWDTGWSPPRPGAPARWNGWYGLGGMTIVDEWFNTDPAQDPVAGRGINVRMFDAEKGEWQMMWIATTGKQVQDLRAKVIDDQLTMWQVYPENTDFKAVFNVIDADHWERIQYKHNESGEWVPAYKLVARRISCSVETD